ncbi:PREDICTED: glutamate receptor 3.6-like [Ipomoea nil]|uniref:glutamate receptor 3.6-like n=1 Tax=Ipomoea nil TaxID=35883 RepID=UPI000900DEED|nr:PREDICTED: glutamate receptor 3.6-like [Ipomoea nil]XP_019185480.1 PREDICTED: glutamate receptor 3.6-like [Ipomoea nil]XP_019185481.1 PREDICTED: glutamate receptor 3.6-like [Ipomoea nil]XP_019185482.1 PREDICTED: glutamate receptor 3.6-like [Ipomoea nil]
MKLFWALILPVLYCGYLCEGVNSTLSARPSVLNIGCILTLRSDVGKITKLVIETAVKDINSNPAVLGGTKLNVTILDNNSSGLMGIVEAIRFLETDTVAIIGPQSSVIAHVISHIANEIHVPLLSFSATDPALTSLQYPFFVRTSPNDMFQMAAIASIVEFYQWKAVIAIYVDDEYGRSGIAALADKLAMRRCRISFKAALKPQATLDEIRDMLVQVALTESRIIIVHTYPYRGLDIFSLAKNLGMTESGYVWIATHWLSTIFDTKGPLSSDVMDSIQGTLTLRAYVPDSEAKRKFVSRWSDLAKRIDSNITLGMCTYGLYAYDTVWLLARALDAFFKQGGNISFSIDHMLDTHRAGLDLHSMNVFDGGKLLLDNILKTNITGVTGLFNFTPDRELSHPAFEVINVIGTGTKKVGYWSNYAGLSKVPSDSLYPYPQSRKLSIQELNPVVWTGDTVQKPRGWVFPNYGKPLKVGVPIRAGFNEFVEQVPGTDMFKGYCIEVFTTALNYLPYAVPYKFVPVEDADDTELVHRITEGVYGAAVGSIAITTNRTLMVDFTQPYIESGLVVVAPFRERGSNAWAFLRPFSPMLWCLTGLFFLVIGVAVWILEHRMNDDFRGPPRKQIETIFWFGISTFFSANRENTISCLGRLVLMIWLFVVLIINSSYTASLTSILTVQHLFSPIKGIDTLLTTNDPIGYQRGSFVRNYLIEELGFHESRLVPFNVTEDYAKALKDGPSKGGVAAVVDERAFVELFLSTHCEFCIVGQEFTRNGWGFAFPKDSPLAVDLSTVILKLSENGELQRIHDKWLLRSACTSQNTKLEVNRLELKSFSGLFFMCGFACLLALLVYLVLVIRQFMQYYDEPEPSSSVSSSRSARLQTFLSFVDEKESSVKCRSKRRQLEGGSSRSTDEGAY